MSTRQPVFRRTRVVLFCLPLLVLTIAGCVRRISEPVLVTPEPERPWREPVRPAPAPARPPRDSARPAPSRTEALERVASPTDWPDLSAAFAARDEGLETALDRSLTWFSENSRRPAYPFQPLRLTQEHARLGVLAFREHLRASRSAADFRARMQRDFDLYGSVGSDGRGSVLFTGYYSPVFRASRRKTQEYCFPVYGKPADLVMDKGGEKVLGRSVGGRLVPYPARAEIERDPAALGLVGREIAWFSNKLDVYLVQVQGSARLDLVDGGPPIYIGYGGTNGREYTGLGKLLVADGKVEKGRVGVPALRAYFRDHPDDLDRYLNRNERFVFFSEISGARWPTGALGVQVSALRTLATDKTLFPRGGVVLVQTQLNTGEGGKRPFDQFMLDQDAGGGILAPGRADIYTGIGDAAGEIAGRQTYSGRLYYFVLKHERLVAWAEGRH